MTRDNVTLSAREQQWGQVLTQVPEDRLPVREAARSLGHSIQHIRRLLAQVRTHGPRALAHNDSHFSELLGEREGLRVSRATVQRVLRQAGIGSPRTRRPLRHAVAGERMPQAGLNRHAPFNGRQSR